MCTRAIVEDYDTSINTSKPVILGRNNKVELPSSDIQELYHVAVN
ncbi:hypothetical protein [Paenibacillus albiflavus]|nr:hypothetical protein [Paenibacillus albiflavus]